MAFDYKTQYDHYKNHFLRLKRFTDQPTAKYSLGLIIALMVTSFFGLFAIKPALTTIAKLSREIEDTNEVNQKLEDKVRSLQQAQIAYSEIEKDLIYINRSLPQKVEFNRIASQINYISYANDLILTSVSYGKFSLVPPGEGTSSMLIKMSLSGDFVNLKTFLKDLENLDRVIKIRAIAFSPKTEVEEAEMETNIDAEVYWLSALEKESL
jgi:Tfp pilus assembly protein PilO